MDNFRITQDLQIRRLKQESAFPIRITDWTRLKRLIETFSTERRLYHDLLSLMIGVFISSVFSLITFYCTKTIPNWAFITTWTTSITSLLLSILLFYQDSQQKKNSTSTKENILDEMDRIEELFDSGSR